MRWWSVSTHNGTLSLYITDLVAWYLYTYLRTKHCGEEGLKLCILWNSFGGEGRSKQDHDDVNGRTTDNHGRVNFVFTINCLMYIWIKQSHTG